MADLRAKIEEQVKAAHVLMYGKTTCGFCSKVRAWFIIIGAMAY